MTFDKRNIWRGFFLLCSITSCAFVTISKITGWHNIRIQADSRLTAEGWVSRPVRNVQQCLRLCWLFTSCRAFSYTPDGGICALQESYGNIESDLSSAVIDMTGASLAKEASALQGCDTRPCTTNEMCVPLRNHRTYGCFPMYRQFCSGDPESVANAAFASDGFHAMTYTCLDGYVRSGTSHLSTCDRSTGQWSDVDIRCTFIDCGQPPSVGGAKIFGSVTSTHFDATVSFICLDGAVSPSASMNIKCQESGRWSRPPEACAVVSCGQPPSLPNATVSLMSRPDDNAHPSLTTNELLLSYDGKANYSCIVGHKSSLGGNFISQCQADGSWSSPAAFVCAIVDCGQPPSMANTTLLTTATVFGSVAMYECIEGHEKIGSPAVPGLVCQENGAWTTEDLSCRPVDCGNPSDEANAMKNYNSTIFKSTVIYTCAPSAVLVSPGYDRRVCQSSGLWSQEVISCEPLPCGPAPPVQHAAVNYSTGKYGIQASYQCEVGYIHIGETSRTCQMNGEWNNVTVTCDTLTCGPPPNVTEGSVEANSHAYLSRAVYTCNTGYRLSSPDSNNKTCLSTGSWSADAVECAMITCQYPPEVANSLLVAGRTLRFMYGNTVSYLCEPGYVLITPTNIRTCLTDGWDTTPIICKAVTCGEPPVVASSERSILTNQTKDVVVYTCVNGTQLVDPAKDRKECEGDLWSDHPVQCERIDCGQPPPVDNGQTDVTSTTANSTVNYTCNSGYYLPSNNGSTRVCQMNGSWSSGIIVCVPVTCGEPPEIYHASLSFNVTTFEAKATYTCHTGYTTVQGKVWTTACLSSGQWDIMSMPGPAGNQTSVVCADVYCDRPQPLQNGMATYLNTTYNSTVVYRCEAGYELNGTSVKICNDSGLWDDANIPNCVLPPQCPDPPHVSNSKIVAESNKTVGSTVQYECLRGFKFFGDPSDNMTLVCMSNRTWSNVSFWCIGIDCGLPPEVAGANSTFVSTTLDSYVTYVCKDGFRPVNNVTQRMCLTSEKWSQDFIECVPENETICPSPPPRVPNARVFYTSVRISSNAIYICNDGYEHWWFKDLYCGLSGQWYPQMVYCAMVDCGEPPDVALASKHYSSTLYGAQVSYTCQVGSELALNQNSKKCTASGIWSGEVVECIPDGISSCGQPPSLEHRTVEFVSTLPGSIAIYRCMEGYASTNARISWQCNSGDGWLGPNEPCDAIECPAPRMVPNAQIEALGKTIGQITMYHCSQGYIHTGRNYAVCQKDGTWSDNLIECVISSTSFCSDPPVRNHHLIDYRSRVVSTEVTYSCRSGYDGGGTFVCVSHGKWKPEKPNCSPLECEDPTELADNTVRILRQIMTVGKPVLYDCGPLRSPLRPYRIICQENATWSSVNVMCTDMVTVASNSCSNPPALSNAVVTIENDSIAKYVCNPGYRALPHNDLARVCLPNGQWSETVMECQWTICLIVPVLPHAMFQNLASHQDRVTYSTDASYRCQEGYHTPDGLADFHIVCDAFVGWTEPPPCNPRHCGPPPVVRGASVSVNETTFLEKAVYTCQRPLVGVGNDSTSTCQKEGMWSTVTLRCEPCDQNPVIRNGSLVVNTEPGQNISDTANYTCDWNFFFFGPYPELVCESTINGPQWTGIENNTCLQNVWTDQTSAVHVPIYHQAITSELRICTQGVYFGTEGFRLSLDSDYDSTVIAFRVRFLELNEKTHSDNSIRFRAKGSSGTVYNYGLKTIPFPFQRDQELTACITANIPAEVYEVFVNGTSLATLDFNPQARFEQARYFATVGDFRIHEIAIDYY